MATTEQRGGRPCSTSDTGSGQHTQSHLLSEGVTAITQRREAAVIHTKRALTPKNIKPTQATQGRSNIKRALQESLRVWYQEEESSEHLAMKGDWVQEVSRLGGRAERLHSWGAHTQGLTCTGNQHNQFPSLQTWVRPTQGFGGLPRKARVCCSSL